MKIEVGSFRLRYTITGVVYPILVVSPFARYRTLIVLRNDGDNACSVERPFEDYDSAREHLDEVMLEMFDSHTPFGGVVLNGAIFDRYQRRRIFHLIYYFPRSRR